MKMKKIVIDGRMLGWTGIGLYTRQLLEHLQQLDQQNQYHVLLLKKDFERWQPQNANFHKVLADYEPYSLGEQIGLAKLLQQLQPTFTHFLAFNHPLLYFGRKITTVHDLTLLYHRNVKGSQLTYWLKQWGFRWVLRHAVKGSRYLITPTEFVRRQIIKHWQIKPTKVHKIWLGVDAMPSTQTAPVNIGNDFVLYVGNAYPYKNLRRLVDGFALASREHANLQLVLAGKPDRFYRQLQDYIKVQNIQNVVFSGYVNNRQLGWLYQHAKLFVFPSISEGFGLPGLEAMLAETPVVAARASSLPEVYQEAALYFDPTDTADLADKINQVLADSGLQQQLRNQGKVQAAKFSWQQTARKTHELYQKT